MKDKRILIIGGIASIVLLTVLFWLQSKGSTILQLPTQWLALSILPIVTSLFVGGFISKFKGFGVELESNLKAPVSSVELAASDAIADIPGDEKRSVGYVQGLSLEKKLSIRWLLFVNGRSNYYSSYAIESYIRELPNLDYFEIRSEQGDIIGFIPISIFKSGGSNYDVEVDHDKLDVFVQAIGNNSVEQKFSGLLVDLKIYSEESLVNVLKKLRSENAEFAAVLSPNGKYLGIILTRDVEKKIANSILAAGAT